MHEPRAAARENSATGYRFALWQFGFLGAIEVHPLRQVQALIRARAAQDRPPCWHDGSCPTPVRCYLSGCQRPSTHAPPAAPVRPGVQGGQP